MIFKKQEVEETRRVLICANLPITAHRYLTFCFLLSIVLGILFGGGYFYFERDHISAILIFILVFGASLLLMRRFPKILAKARAETIQSDLPVAIRSLAIQLNMKVPFEVALENIAEGDYRCSSEFQKMVNEVSRGSSIPEALGKMSERIDSTIVKKIIVQLIRSYEEGTGGEPLKKLADELMSVQKLKFKEFSARLSFLGLLFIALACIAPTLFLAYGMVAAMYLGVKITTTDIWLMFLILFPIVNILLILYIKAKTPQILTAARIKFLSSRERELIESEMRRWGIKISFPIFTGIVSVFSIVLAAIAYHQGILSGLSILLLPVFFYFLFLYRIEKRSKEIESYLPDSLFQVGTLEKGVPMERIMKNLAKSGYSSLSDEFAMASRQVSAGTSITKSLNGIKERNASSLLDRVITLLNQCYKTGKDVQSVIRETAEDVFELLTIAKEQAAILAMQKYTILLGGCIIIPIILAFVISIIGSLEYPAIAIAKITQAERQLLIDASISAAQAYLIIYTFLASIFVSFQEGRTRKFVVYFLIFVVIAIALFNIVRTQVSII